MSNTAIDSQHEWTLEIVPAHADRISVLKGLVNEIFVTMIPGTPVQESLEALSAIKEQGFSAVPHITARNFQSDVDLKALFDEIKRLEITKVLILAGGHGQAAGPYKESMDVLQNAHFTAAGIQQVAVAGHPEGNPDDPECWDSLQRKWDFLQQQGIAMEIVTQWSFSTEKMNDYLVALKERGINAPVRVGIAGPASLKTLLKFAKVCGVNAAATVIKKQGFSMGRLLVSNKPEAFVSEITGTSKFHLYPFGGLEKCAKWLEAQLVSA